MFVRSKARSASDPILDMKRYLFRVAASVLAERHRVNASDRIISCDLEDERERFDAVSPERALIGAQELQRLMLALSELPPRTREAFILHRFEDVTYDGIARRLGISRSGVEKLIMRALDRLMKALQASR